MKPTQRDWLGTKANGQFERYLQLQVTAQYAANK
jgi:hypothetical protein